jgi:hypothetical protein
MTLSLLGEDDRMAQLSGAALRAGTGPLEVGAKRRNAAEAREEASSRSYVGETRTDWTAPIKRLSTYRGSW